jgi:hypothetical protein
MALSLQDYQDLVFATPCLMWTLCAMQAKHWRWVLAGAIVGCLPREECVPLVLACAMVSYPGTRRAWFRNIGICLGVALVYVVGLSLLFPLAPSQHDMPLVNAIHQVFQWPPQLFLDGWPYFGEFYSLLWAPIGLLALLAPELILPGLGLVFLHMTIPWGHGVDRSWGGHVHHMGPALPFFTAAAILGSARLIRWVKAQSRIPKHGVLVLVGLLAAYGLHWNHNWAQHHRLRLAWTPTAPAYTHPIWSLVDEHLDPEDVPILSSNLALAVSARSRSYTYNESLFEKAPGEGLGAGTHLIVDRRNTLVLDWGMAMTGAESVAQSGPYVLIEWTSGALDQKQPARPPQVYQGLQVWPGMPQDRTVIDGVPPRKAPPPPPQGDWNPDQPIRAPLRP